MPQRGSEPRPFDVQVRGIDYVRLSVEWPHRGWDEADPHGPGVVRSKPRLWGWERSSRLRRYELSRDWLGRLGSGGVKVSRVGSAQRCLFLRVRLYNKVAVAVGVSMWVGSCSACTSQLPVGMLRPQQSSQDVR